MEGLNRPASARTRIRFPQVDAAGIVFYPRYVEMLARHLPGVTILSPPCVFSMEFRRANRLGDDILLSFAADPGTGKRQVIGSMQGEEYFVVRAEEATPLRSDQHEPGTSAFRTEPEGVGDWSVGSDGRLRLSRYFEHLNEAIEKWFEDTLEISFSKLHVEKEIGIPTVSFHTRCAAMPAAGTGFTTWLRPLRLGQRSMTFKSWFVCNDRCLVETEQVIVFVRMMQRDFRTIAIPEDVRRAFGLQLADSVEVS